MTIEIRVGKDWVHVSARSSPLTGWVEWWTNDSQGVAQPKNWRKI